MSFARHLLAVAFLGGVASAAAHGPEDNRLWRLDLELEGPLTEVVLDAGPAGRTRVVAELVRGERRRLSVPVPVRSPFGADELATLPEPRVEVFGGGEARLLGWSDEQPARAFEAFPAGLEADVVDALLTTRREQRECGAASR